MLLYRVLFLMNRLSGIGLVHRPLLGRKGHKDLRQNLCSLGQSGSACYKNVGQGLLTNKADFYYEPHKLPN